MGEQPLRPEPPSMHSIEEYGHADRRGLLERVRRRIRTGYYDSPESIDRLARRILALDRLVARNPDTP